MNSSQNASTTPTRGEERGTGSRNPFVAIGLFIRQVFAELRKVVVPTRRELAVYTLTVLVFVAVMILMIFGLDAGFSWLSRLVFAVPD